jgi:hypothetical protein
MATFKNRNDAGLNCLYFASNLELTTYTSLVKLYGQNRVICQVPIIIKPEGSVFPEQVWRVDFGILHSSISKKDKLDSYLYFIEVKGKWVENNGYKGEFLRTLQLLESFQPVAMQKLVICGADTFQLTKRVTICKIEHMLAYLKKEKEPA